MQNLPYIITSFLLAIGISLYAVPIVIRVAHSLKLMDNPNERSAAKSPIPTLGGIAIFLSFVFASTVGMSGAELPEMVYILSAVILMFFVGLKDDILNLSAWKKLVAQLITSAIIVFFAKIRFTNLHGFFGIGAIEMLPSVLLTFFVIIVIINAFNLMDGIDGLAAGLSMMAGIVFGVWFFISGHHDYAILSFALVGATSGFFYYNLYGKKNKIFMGDTGSLVLGTLMAIIVIRFNEFNIDQTQPFAIASAPAVSFGILIYPLIDTIRVFIIRLLQFKSPFTADKNHLHHRFLTLGFSHKRATYTIISINILFIIPVFALQHIGIIPLMGFIILTSGILFMIPALFIHRRHLIKENDPHQQLLMPGMTYELIRNRKYVLKVSKHDTRKQGVKLQTFFQKLNLW
ncbi:MAG: undecaprenyl/decaprenyl-phosphate alpha-N-acetylglucosaminyl 1-phosphate transferase [Mariniphaga sp.]|nr:undecaprenyl/decaprenyl-phosphate alpha-N-acetylglucosaminyl 1-phosphate transferase [Mariniphaga sp.]